MVLGDPNVVGAPFPTIVVSGASAREVGLSHGTQLSFRIKKNIEWYVGYFNRCGYSSSDLQVIANSFAQETRLFSPGSADEIEAIAEAAGVESWEVWVLNARTEIVQSVAAGREAVGAAAPLPTECTALYSRSHSILAQNWDWDKVAEGLTVFLLVDRTDTGQKILQIAEPGIIGKAGLNSVGIGVTLNILGSAHTQGDNVSGVPVHVLLRSVLECSSIDTAVARVCAARKQWGTQSCFIIGNDAGQCAILELNGETVDVVYDAEPAVHTNHYCGLGKVGVVSPPRHFVGQSSGVRFDRAAEMMQAAGAKLDVAAGKQVLTDQQAPEWPIAVPFQWREGMAMEIGTVTSLVMDLGARTMHATPGSPLEHDFTVLEL